MSHTTQSSFEQNSGFVKAASLLLFIVVGAYSNGRVIHTVLLGDVHRPVLNFFVACLNSADLASCLIIMPFVFVSLVFGQWVFGSIFCTIHTMLSTCLANVAFLSVGAWCTHVAEPSIEDVSPVCQNDRLLLCCSSSGSSQFHSPRPCCAKNSLTLSSLDCVSSTPLNTELLLALQNSS